MTTQTANATLPANYRMVFENADVLVMHVHYGPHEFVPMHDHSAYPTVYVYLNNSGELDINHEEPNGFTAHRPPTHTGAFRIAPGMTERHSITNLSDTPSDFLRVELKRIPATDLKQVSRGEASSPPVPGTRTEFHDAALEIDRTICPPQEGCLAPSSPARSLLVAIRPTHVQTASGVHPVEAGGVFWLPAGEQAAGLDKGAETLRLSLLFPE